MSLVCIERVEQECVTGKTRWRLYSQMVHGAD